MKHIFFATAALGAIALAGPAQAQTEGPTPFTSENAILDTGIPFAIGAREAQQNLRGSFGWSTFQEGLVEGVYFRFDPDGYARFSPSPRLDTDVFEVICRPRTYTCMARKDALSVIPLPNGKIQLKLEDVRPGDGLFLSDAKSELQLPDRVLQPLEFQFETLLSAGGEIIVRRGEKELLKTSLSGFGAVVSYLRWISARQDYTVLPRNWPVPNAQGSSDGAITNAVEWSSPMPQPQAIQQVGHGAQYVNSPQYPANDKVTVDLDELRQLLAVRANDPEAEVLPSAPQPTDDRTATLERAIEQLMIEVRLLRDGQTAQGTNTVAEDQQQAGLWTDPVAQVPESTTASAAATVQNLPTDMSLVPVVPMVADALPTEVDHLDYLINEMGLAPKTAMILLQIVSDGSESATKTDQIERSYHDSLAVTILNELERDLAQDASGTALPSVTQDQETKKMADQSAPQDELPSDGGEKLVADGAKMADVQAGGEAVDMTDPNVKSARLKPAVNLSNAEFQPLTAYFKSVIKTEE